MRRPTYSTAPPPNFLLAHGARVICNAELLMIAGRCCLNSWTIFTCQLPALPPLWESKIDALSLLVELASSLYLPTTDVTRKNVPCRHHIPSWLYVAGLSDATRFIACLFFLSLSISARLAKHGHFGVGLSCPTNRLKYNSVILPLPFRNKNAGRKGLCSWTCCFILFEELRRPKGDWPWQTGGKLHDIVSPSWNCERKTDQKRAYMARRLLGVALNARPIRAWISVTCSNPGSRIPQRIRTVI